MRPAGKAGELFRAFSRINASAFQDDRLLSCPTLSKAPNYGNVLRRFLTGAPQGQAGRGFLLRAAARYAAANVLHLGFMLLARLFIAVLRWKAPASLGAESLRRSGAPLAVIDTFAVLPKIAKDGAYTELYLPGLAEEARRAGHAPVMLYRLYGSRNPLTLWKALSVLKNAGDGITEAHLLAAGDWARLFAHTVLYPVALWRLVRSLTHFASGTPESYIREALVHTAGQCALLGESRRLAAFRLGMWLSALPRDARGARLFSWYENQTLNKALQRGLAQAEDRTGRHVPVAGAQLFIWPDTLLNNHPDDAEAALGLAPDIVLVNGPFFLPEESKRNYAVGPSLRYADLFSRMRRGDASALDGPLLVLLSYHPDEVRKVLELALPLAGEAREVVYKFHPATRPEDFAAWLPSGAKLAGGSLAACIESCGAVLGSGSGSLAEAAVLGAPVLQVEEPGGLSLNYLPEFGENEIWARVSRAADVTKALDRLGAFRSGPEYEARLEAFRSLLFTEPTPERIRGDFGLE